MDTSLVLVNVASGALPYPFCLLGFVVKAKLFFMYSPMVRLLYSLLLLELELLLLLLLKLELELKVELAPKGAAEPESPVAVNVEP